MIEPTPATPRNRRLRRGRALLRRHGPAAPSWRQRAAIFSGAVAVGLVAILFARMADAASDGFLRIVAARAWAPFLLTPLSFAAIAWVTRAIAPAAAGSGIPQIIAAKEDPASAMRSGLTSGRTAIAKALLTGAGLACGASVGREGPTVQLGATVMAYTHRLFRVPLRGSVLVAGAAAGVAAAFNTPLAGVAFAIEELAVAYEQRMTLLVMTAVLIAGMISLGLAGDYVYFGIVGQALSIGATLLLAPIAGVAGGVAGGLFSRAMLRLSAGGSRVTGRRPVLFAAACGLLVAALGTATGLTWGTGYAAARSMIDGAHAPLWFGPAKFAATLATAAAGLPGGIFAPTLSIGAGLGNGLHALFPAQPTGAVVLLGVVAYFVGVVRAPLTAVIIVTETTASRQLMLPLLATALIAEGAASLVCKERLYHGLARRYRPVAVAEAEGGADPA